MVGDVVLSWDEIVGQVVNSTIIGVVDKVSSSLMQVDLNGTLGAIISTTVFFFFSPSICSLASRITHSTAC